MIVLKRRTVFVSESAEVNFTLACATKVKSLIEDEQNPNLKLRVYIMGGGCSGFQYGFMFDEAVNDDDMQIVTEVADDDADTVQAVTLLIDPMSFQYLKGADIDYREDVNGSQFVIRNPNAKTTCGCGSSFSVE